MQGGFPGGSEVKESACSAGDLGSIPGLGKSPGEGNGNPLQYSCLENPMDGGAWWATVHGVAKSQTRLSDFTAQVQFMLWNMPSVLFCSVKSLSRVRLFATPWTVAHQAFLSMEFSRKEYWSGLSYTSPADLPNNDIHFCA